ncbi:S-layer homology domain-containing protein [Cytobacillus sp. Hm23]
MPQQFPHGSANDKYKRKLFVDNGFKYEEVKARIIDPYINPVPQPNTKEVKLINAPSHIQQMGLASYKTTLTLLFDKKEDYANYVAFVGWGHKFYDERGAIFIGSVESIKANSVEANKRYKVEINLILIKKDQNDHHKKDMKFQDVDQSSWFYTELDELSKLGIVTTYDTSGQPMLYFRPHDNLTRAQLVALMMRTKRLVEKILRE